MIFLLILLKIVLVVVAREPPPNASLSELYGEGYGTEWIYYPDEEGIPYFVPLGPLATRMSFFSFETADEIEDLVQFRHHTGNSSKQYNLLNKNAEPIQPNIKIEFSQSPFKIITHGWKSSADTPSVRLIADAYLQTTSYNIITIDWSEVADNLWYPIVASNTRPMGDLVGQFLKALQKLHGVERMHLIGHSLGAHVLGNAAFASKISVSRITGLDPARPLFEYPYREHSLRLDQSDALFVDAIHTCAGVLGYHAPLGNADFYPNGGEPPQPGCGNIRNMMESCSHGRAYVYFAESITHPQNFPAYPCKDWLEYKLGKCNKDPIFMGDAVNQQARGNFFLHTNSERLFGLSPLESTN